MFFYLVISRKSILKTMIAHCHPLKLVSPFAKRSKFKDFLCWNKKAIPTSSKMSEEALFNQQLDEKEDDDRFIILHIGSKELDNLQLISSNSDEL